MRKSLQIALVSTLLIGFSAPASAAVTICLGGGCAAQPNSNIQLAKDVTGEEVTGTLNNAPGTVTFSSTEKLINTSNGQASIAAVDGVLNNPLTVTYNEGLISALELKISGGKDGTVIFTFQGGDSDGLVTDAYQIGSSGFFNAFNGTFESVTLSFGNDANVSNVGQFRISTAPVVAGVPEPATWAMMLLGFTAIGFSVRRRKPVAARVRYT
ncbi:MAG: hypothetical protein CVT74_11915 [Alphaproteobacteria bacterium HGW-Alphaproteobacteria-13]|jgi:hypothetical protein|nr:MAG: hypothetical protein CVT74_11915 [Alphaproteobacteria bacterium HGW-Alphaproteobacteria-13]